MRFVVAVLLLLAFKSPAAQAPPPESNRKVTVSTSRDLQCALQSNTTIYVEPGIYRLEPGILPPGESPAVWEKVFDGRQLVLTGITNLTIVGIGKLPPRILVRPAYANVLTFRQSKNLAFRNLHFEHDQPRGYCVGGVLHFKGSEKILVDHCVLRGSGTEGITLLDSHSLLCQQTTISDCTYGIMTLENSADVRFQNCDFRNCSEFDLVSITGCQQVRFEICEIHENTTAGENHLNYALFRITKSGKVSVSGCYIHDNRTQYFSNSRAALGIAGCKFKQNRWRLGKFEPIRKTAGNGNASN